MTSEQLQPRRWQNLPESIRIDAKSKVLFYGGCAPYFDIFFRKFLNIDTNRILEDSLRLLNFFDIEPRVWQNERCCGHDLLWSGDRTNFMRLARLNVKAIADSGVEEIITACPECFHTLGVAYERQGIPMPVKVTHIHDFLEKQIDKGAVGFKSLDKQMAFQDACRQTRLCGQGELPRKLLGRLTHDGRASAKDLNAASMCCGNSAWIGCDAFSKKMQVERINQVHQQGSDLMITACPKCQVHLRCAMEDAMHGDELRMEIMDLTSVIAQTIYWE
jgi:Fe-S oxidoreductase